MSADKSVSAILAATHKTDLLLIGCGIGLTLGVTAGILYPLPESSRVKSLWFKALLSVSGGLSAFVYALSKGAIGVGGVLIRSGAGSPEGALTANIGSLYLRTDGDAGTTLYIKESGTGSTGWVAK